MTSGTPLVALARDARVKDARRDLGHFRWVAACEGTIQFYDQGKETSEPSTAERYFPQIADGGGYTTQFILLGGLPGQILTGRVRFFPSSDQPLDFDFP